MPSGARKRKANKKKGKNGDSHNNSSSNSSSTTHSQGSEDPRSLDDRESDSGEIESVNYEVGGTKGKRLSDEIGEIKREIKNEKNDAVVAKETTIGIVSNEGSFPTNGGLQDKEVVVEEEKSIVSEFKEELKALDVSSVIEKKAEKEIPKQDAIAVESASVELVKDSVSFTKEINAGFGRSVTSELFDPGLVKNADLALPISDEKKKLSSNLEDLKSEKIESKIVKIDEGKTSVALPVDYVSGLDTVKKSETSNAASVTATQVSESVKNKEETLKQSDSQGGYTAVITSSEVDKVKEIETQKRSTDTNQTLIGSNPLPVRRTSMMGCCGLFELFSGGNR